MLSGTAFWLMFVAAFIDELDDEKPTLYSTQRALFPVGNISPAILISLETPTSLANGLIV